MSKELVDDKTQPETEIAAEDNTPSELRDKKQNRRSGKNRTSVQPKSGTGMGKTSSELSHNAEQIKRKPQGATRTIKIARIPTSTNKYRIVRVDATGNRFTEDCFIEKAMIESKRSGVRITHNR